MQRYVVDGNFTAQHMNMKQPHLDVTLSDGLGYMVTDIDYQAHLSSAKETNEVCSSKGFNLSAPFDQKYSSGPPAAITVLLMQQTQIGVIFEQPEWLQLLVHVMDALFLTPWWIFRRVNGRFYILFNKYLPKLMHIASHMNVDYSICNAINYHSENIETSLIIYDIGCQWCIHFRDRINNSPELSLPEKCRVLTGVGKFHLSAHKLPCFARFSLNFIEGAGQVDGEIMETLWAPFNKISPTARSMSQYHRQEILDDHMRDSNWKKLVGIGE
jgi:hypothetical protein